MKPISILLMLMLATTAFCDVFPDGDYDFHIPQRQVSSIVSSFGTMSVTYQNEPGIIYNNPAMLAYSKQGIIATVLKVDSDEEKSFSEMIRFNSMFKSARFDYMTIYSEKAGFAYYPLHREYQNDIWIDDQDVSHRTYKDYNLDTFHFGVGEIKGKMAWGLGMKYHTGSLTYLTETLHDTLWVRNDFTKDDVDGFSFDFGMLYNYNMVRIGFTLYDFYSHLYWGKHNHQILQQRAALGLQVGNEAYKLILTGQAKLDKDPEATYHIGLERGFSFSENPNVPSTLFLRFGCFSEQYDNEDNVFQSWGFGYYYQMARLDFSMLSRGFKGNTSRYQLSISMGL